MNRKSIIIIVAVVALSLCFVVCNKINTDNKIDSLERDIEQRQRDEYFKEQDRQGKRDYFVPIY